MGMSILSGIITFEMNDGEWIASAKIVGFRDKGARYVHARGKTKEEVKRLLNGAAADLERDHEILSW